MYGTMVFKQVHLQNRSLNNEVDIGRMKSDGLVQDCSDSIAKAMELLQSCTEPLTYCLQIIRGNPFTAWPYNSARGSHVGVLRYHLLQACVIDIIQGHFESTVATALIPVKQP